MKINRCYWVALDNAGLFNYTFQTKIDAARYHELEVKVYPSFYDKMRLKKIRIVEVKERKKV